ncbi:hypothetical protein FOC4_g10015230 [Fusarium odoratissimum]|uniref:Uncharacterized protein n=1 Tax=Fusarium oxysporum f. sp. cubense (strain race 4) TaxID=2502994 RepID=N1RCU4_FUSC4|nr:hypothetical protein FOC4_g10015230 [Fusarium odoratissimum]
MDYRSQPTAKEEYTANVDQTLRELQERVQQHENELEKLRSEQSQPPESAAGQARLIQVALKEVTESDPFLPSPGSLLPTLLAFRKTHQTIQESKSYLASQRVSHEQLSRQLEADEARLKDQKLLGDALTARILSLRDEVDAGTHVTPGEGAEELLQELRAKKKSYDRETSKLMKVLLRLGPRWELQGPQHRRRACSCREQVVWRRADHQRVRAKKLLPKGVWPTGLVVLGKQTYWNRYCSREFNLSDNRQFENVSFFLLFVLYTLRGFRRKTCWCSDSRWVCFGEILVK